MFFTSVKFDRNSTVNFAVDKVVELDEVFSVNNRREEDFRRRSLVFAGLNTFRTDKGVTTGASITLPQQQASVQQSLTSYLLIR